MNKGDEKIIIHLPPLVPQADHEDILASDDDK